MLITSIQTMAPSGSNVGRQNGNTYDDHSDAEESKPSRGNAKKGWFITLSAEEGSSDSICQWVRANCDEGVWTMEVGNETGYVHYHVSLVLKKKQRFQWLKNHLSRTANISAIRNWNAAFDYSQKDPTRIGGPWYWPERIGVVKDPLKGLEYYEWEKEILEYINEPADDRSIMWYWSEKGDTGKSKFAKHLYLTKPDTMVCIGKVSDIYYAISQSLKLLIVDIPRSRNEYMKNIYTVLEEVKNGLVFSGKYESKVKCFDPPHVLVFANVAPDETQLSEDRWIIRNID